MKNMESDEVCVQDPRPWRKGPDEATDSAQVILPDSANTRWCMWCEKRVSASGSRSARIPGSIKCAACIGTRSPKLGPVNAAVLGTGSFTAAHSGAR
jgi:hypothetical protein